MKKSNKLILISVILIAVIVGIFMLIPNKPDIKAEIVSIECLSASEETEYYLLHVDGSEFGYADSVYILINENTVVKKSDGKDFLPESFLVKDVIEVYYDKSTINQNIITAKKVVLKYYAK